MLRLLTLLFCFGFASFAAPAHAVAAWNLNDVTYLFPLPEDGQSDPSKIALAPSFLPLNLYASIPASAFSQDSLTQHAPQIRVVAVRVDPTQNQVRIVWQSVVLKTTAQRVLPAYAAAGIALNASLDQPSLPVSKTYTSEDYSLHSFYQLTPASMAALLGKLASLKQTGAAQTPPVITDKLPLGVHPGFLSASYRGNFAASLKTLLTQFCTVNTLFKATISVASTPEIWWDFSGVEKKNGVWSTVKIPNVDQPSQGFASESMERDALGVFPTGLRANIVPVDSRQENLANLIAYSTPGDTQDLPLYQSSMLTIRKFQNPALTNTDTLDCVQCHISEGSEFWMKQSIPGFQNGLNLSSVSFQNPNPALFDLSNHSVSPRSTKVLRALGYWNAYPAFNQRVINESAQSAAFLNTQATR